MNFTNEKTVVKFIPKGTSYLIDKEYEYSEFDVWTVSYSAYFDGVQYGDYVTVTDEPTEDIINEASSMLKEEIIMALEDEAKKLKSIKIDNGKINKINKRLVEENSLLRAKIKRLEFEAK